MKRLFSLLLLFTLSGCLGDARQAVQDCTTAAGITYPPDKPMPLGEPYKEILSCMQKSGYVIDYNGPCKYRDYTANAGDPYCYRPTNFFTGYIHDIRITFR